MSVSPILTVDVEDWFHVCGHPRYSDPATWAGREGRVRAGVERVLGLLEGTGSTATFFVLGWVARQSPALVRRIADAGHAIGCHGDTHRRVFEMTLVELREEVRRSRGTLREILGRPVTAFRAPEWSMLRADNPALAVLVEEGFTVDSSLTTAPPVGDPANPVRPTILSTAAGPILEVPPLMGTFFGFRAMWGGGVCARLTRESRVANAVERSLAAGVPPVLYAHPWEFDDAHPAMPGLSPVQRLVHFAGRARTERRWARFLKRWTFAPISSARPQGEEEISAHREKEKEEEISSNGKKEKAGVAA
ncbi:MAG: polysaccharide deacetylase family protein [Thermoanaerobaculia bacterium]